eukprot:746990-Hanusia_phi.AAC.3
MQVTAPDPRSSALTWLMSTSFPPVSRKSHVLPAHLCRRLRLPDVDLSAVAPAPHLTADEQQAPDSSFMPARLGTPLRLRALGRTRFCCSLRKHPDAP